MFLKKISFLTLFCCVGYVLSKGQKKVACALDDSRCTTSAVDPLYKNLIMGRPDLGVPTSDPVHQDVIVGVLKGLNYTLTDANLYGLKDCRVKKHSINVQETSWTFDIQCPNLTLKSNYETAGVIGGNYVEGKGQCHINYEKYRIGMRGKLDFTTLENGKTHIKIGDFDFHLLEAVKNVKYEFTNLYYGDEAKSRSMHKYLNENWKSATSFLQYPAMHSFLGKMFQNFNQYLADVPVDELFYKTVSD